MSLPSTALIPFSALRVSHMTPSGLALTAHSAQVTRWSRMAWTGCVTPGRRSSVCAPGMRCIPLLRCHSRAAVNPGDAIQVIVKYLGGGVFNLVFNDVTQHAGFNVNQSCPSGSTCLKSSAEVITEDPGGAVPSGVDLADYGMVNFTNAKAAFGFAFWPAAYLYVLDGRLRVPHGRPVRPCHGPALGPVRGPGVLHHLEDWHLADIYPHEARSPLSWDRASVCPARARASSCQSVASLPGFLAQTSISPSDGPSPLPRLLASLTCAGSSIPVSYPARFPDLSPHPILARYQALSLDPPRKF